MDMWKRCGAVALVLAGVTLICGVAYQVFTGTGDGRYPFAMLAESFSGLALFVLARDIIRGFLPRSPPRRDGN